MARLGIPPHVADKILNHQSGTISGVAAVYQRHDFLDERNDALERWGAHVAKIAVDASSNRQNAIRRVALCRDQKVRVTPTASLAIQISRNPCVERR
jgi:hypothetical protein